MNHEDIPKRKNRVPRRTTQEVALEKRFEEFVKGLPEPPRELDPPDARMRAVERCAQLYAEAEATEVGALVEEIVEVAKEAAQARMASGRYKVDLPETFPWHEVRARLLEREGLYLSAPRRDESGGVSNAYVYVIVYGWVEGDQGEV